LKKALLLLVLIAICAIGWYRVPIMKKFGILKPETTALANSLPKSNFILPDPVPVGSKPPPCMTLAEYTEKQNTDPNAYYKFLYCDEQATNRTEFEKLMNFFTRLKYE
jgi:hypothetical protein